MWRKRGSEYHDDVNVAGGDAGADDGIGALSDDGRDAKEAPECGCRFEEGCCDQKE